MSERQAAIQTGSARPTGPPSALLTGATGGIGQAIADRLALEGYALTVSGRDQNILATLARDLGAYGTTAQVVPADMTAEDQVRILARRHIERFDSLDLLVLSAGTGASGPIVEYPMRRFDRQVAVNIRAPFTLVQECLPALRRAAARHPARGARIVAIASMTGIASQAGLAAYGATKAALISLCQSINVEESSAGVNATAISPGYVDTEMSTWTRPDSSCRDDPCHRHR